MIIKRLNWNEKEHYVITETILNFLLVLLEDASLQGKDWQSKLIHTYPFKEKYEKFKLINAGNFRCFDYGRSRFENL